MTALPAVEPTSPAPAAAAALRLPRVTQEAVFTLSAPWHQWRTQEDLVRWAERRLRFSVDCMLGKHRVQVDPHTIRFTDLFGSAEIRERTVAAHLLWTLRHPAPPPPLPCRLFEHTLATWAGAYQPTDRRRWNLTWHQKMHALRAVIRTVQYLDAGLDLHAHQRWLELGATPDTVSWVRDHLQAYDVPDAEGQVLDDLINLSAKDGSLRRQQRNPTQELLCAVADTQIRKQARVKVPPPSQVRPGTGGR